MELPLEEVTSGNSTVGTKPMREQLTDLDRKIEMKKAGKTWPEMGFKDEGDMRWGRSSFLTWTT